MRHLNFSFKSRWLLLPLMLLTLSVGQMWGADVITPVSGSQYRFKAVHTGTGAGTYYLVAPTSTDYGGATTTEANGTVFTFTKESNDWYITFTSGNTTYYMYESGTNGKVSISTTKTKMNTVSTNGNYTKIGSSTKWIQFNYNNGNCRFGCYGSVDGAVLSEVAAATPRTVTWKCNNLSWTSGVVTGNTTVASGSKISAMPTAPTTSNCDNTKVFVGWTATKDYSNATTAPTDLFSDVATSPTISADVTFYAVFATQSDFTRVTNTNQLGAGKLLVVVDNSNSKALTITPGYANAPTENAQGKITPDANMIWTLEASSSNWKLKTGCSYLGTSSTDNSTQVSLTSTNSTWEIASSSGATNTFYLRNTAKAKCCLEYYSSSPKWVVYANNSYTSSPYFTEKLYVASRSNYATSCCQSLGQINGSFFWTTHFCPAWPEKHRS